MNEPQAQYGNDGSQSPREGPNVLDAYDPDSSYDEDAHPSPARYGSEHGGSSAGSPTLYEFSDRDHGSRDHGSDEGGHPNRPNFDGDAGDRSSSYASFLASANRQISRKNKRVQDPFFHGDDDGELQRPSRPFTMHSRVSSHSSIGSIVDEHGSSSPLNKAMETFTDANGEVSQDFVQKLRGLNSDNSKGDLCIEKYLEKAEKAHFVVLKKEKVETSKAKDGGSETPSIYTAENDPANNLMPEVPMTRMQIFMGRMIGEWPLYSIVMSAGQLLSATAFQLVLLSGTSTQQDLDLYLVGAMFFTASIVWWVVFRLQPAAVGLSVPWIL